MIKQIKLREAWLIVSYGSLGLSVFSWHVHPVSAWVSSGYFQFPSTVQNQEVRQTVCDWRSA